jgi:hypothetical protein
MNDHEMLTQFLRDRDATCPTCTYNLRGLQADKCPECGSVVFLTVSGPRPPQAAQLTGLVGLCMGLGLNLMLLVYIAIAMHMGRAPSGAWRHAFVWVNVGGAIVLGAILIVWLKRWQSTGRLRPAVRWFAAAFCWLLSLVDVIIFSVSIR